MAGCTIGVHYPAPIVDDKLAMKAAKDRMYGLRQTEAARNEADQVQARHGSRKSGLPPSDQRRSASRKPLGKQTAKRNAPQEPTVSSPQGDLFA